MDQEMIFQKLCQTPIMDMQKLIKNPINPNLKYVCNNWFKNLFKPPYRLNSRLYNLNPMYIVDGTGYIDTPATYYSYFQYIIVDPNENKKVLEERDSCEFLFIQAEKDFDRRIITINNETLPIISKSSISDKSSISEFANIKICYKKYAEAFTQSTYQIDVETAYEYFIIFMSCIAQQADATYTIDLINYINTYFKIADKHVTIMVQHDESIKNRYNINVTNTSVTFSTRATYRVVYVEPDNESWIEVCHIDVNLDVDLVKKTINLSIKSKNYNKEDDNQITFNPPNTDDNQIPFNHPNTDDIYKGSFDKSKYGMAAAAVAAGATLVALPFILGGKSRRRRRKKSIRKRKSRRRRRRKQSMNRRRKKTQKVRNKIR